MRQGQLRVLHVMREASGGMVTHVSALIGALHRLGLESVVAGPTGALRRLRARPGGSDVAERTVFAELPVADGVRPVDDVRSALRLRRLERELRPDVVHTHGHKAAWTYLLAASHRRAASPGTPLRGAGLGPAWVVTVHNFLPARRLGLQAAVERRVARSVLYRADAIIAVSDVLREFTEKLLGRPVPGAAGTSGGGVPATGEGGQPSVTDARPRVRVVRNALDPTWLALQRLQRDDGGARLASEERTARANGEVVVACAVRLHDPKGVATLVEAAARLSAGLGVNVWIAGDGPERPALEAKARALGLDGRVRFLGWANPLQVWASADIAVLPWLREGASYSALEAMAAGLPVVSFDCPGCREVLCDGAGLIVPEASAEALAAALERLARDPSRRREMGEKARQLAAARTSVEMGEETLGVYREAVRLAWKAAGLV